MVFIIVTTTAHPHLSVVVCTQAMQVYVNIYLSLFLECSKVYHAHRPVIVRHAIAARVCHIQLIVNDSELLWLIAYSNGINLLQRKRIHFIHSAYLRISVNIYRSYVG